MTKKLFIGMLAAICIAIFSLPAAAQRSGFGNLYYEGEVVRTVVPPSSMPKPGRDNFYVVMNGVEEQLGIAAVAPGDKDYHGGKWAFHSVMWLVEPYLLTSEADVLDAASFGDVTITRLPQKDFKCPIQP
jgi:hypothetical protein